MKPFWKSRWFRPIITLILVLSLCLIPVSDAWARSGGRVGGGSFRRPTTSAPRSLSRGRGGQPTIFPGGGFGFPLFFPFFWGGGGGVITLFLLLGVGSFVFRAIRSATAEASEAAAANPNVQLQEIKIGLLASARNLQKEINGLALEADTETAEGLRQLLQNVTLTLVRNDEYWVYGQANRWQTRLAEAEQHFNQQSLAERSKFSRETLSNVEGQQSSATSSSNSMDGVGEYIAVTLLVASYAPSGTLPDVDSAATLRRSLMQLGSIASDQLVAVEVLWTPQVEGDVLSAEALLTEYPQLQRL